MDNSYVLRLQAADEACFEDVCYQTALVDIAKRTTKAPVTYVPYNELPGVAEEDSYQISPEKLRYLIAALPPVRKKILDLKINGYSNKEIASQLTITV